MTDNKGSTDDQNSEKLLDDSSSDDDSPDPSLKTTEEERHGTISGSKQATAMALMCMKAQANPTVERGKPIKRSKKRNKNPQTKSTQTNGQK